MSRTSIIALVVFVALTVLVLTMRTGPARRLQAGAMELVRPLHSTTSGVGRSLGALGGGLKSLDVLESENKELAVENQLLKTRQKILDGLEKENDGLRQALGFTKRTQFKLLPARIIARSAAAWWSTVQIDKGERDGLDEDMPVVSDIGLVGKTTTVSPHTAFVLLVTDENCKVAASVEGTKEKGIVSGERTGTNVQPNLSLNFLSKNAEIKPGMKVFSAGVSGGVFPYNLLLGTIRDFQVRDLAGQATVTPAVEISALENVFVILPDRKGEGTKTTGGGTADDGTESRRPNGNAGGRSAAAGASSSRR